MDQYQLAVYESRKRSLSCAYTRKMEQFTRSTSCFSPPSLTLSKPVHRLDTTL